MTRIILVRHGRTNWNESRRVQGSSNETVLTPEGETQCRCLAERLQKEPVEAVYSSPLSRAIGTAKMIADGHNLPIIQEPAFREVECGAMEGAETKEIGSRLQLLLKGGSEGELLFKGCGGESLGELRDRAWNAVLQMVQRHPDATIVAVSHYFVIAAILCAVMNIPATQLGRFRMGEATVSVIAFDAYGPYLALFNDRCHLARL